MQTRTVEYAATRRFTELVLDHVSNAPFLSGFREHAPTIEGLKAAATAREFPASARAVLVRALRRQYQGLDISGAVERNLTRLAEPAALTITTGHQLCLFTGPLYFPLKIMNVIRLARDLESATGRPVIPVFWMATEDHDRPEVDHAWFGDQRMHWPGETAGPVGRLQLNGIAPLVERACALLGDGAEADRMKELLRSSYTEGRTLADATRRFVHALFGRFGLVIVDGDDRDLKQLFVPVMQEELLNGIAERTVRYADERLAERYKVQAHARPINLFHLSNGHRRRIERTDSGFQVVDGGPVFSAEELLLDLEVRPQDYSPNVLLRPVYQETVLPNIAYVGGGGELAYWMQLKWLFQAVRVPMPVVLLRTSVALLPAKGLRQWESLGLGLADLFRPRNELMDAVATSASGASAAIDQERSRLEVLFRELAERARTIDPTLEASTLAAGVRAAKVLDGVGERMRRALRRKESVAVQRAARVLDALFPDGGLQERRLCIVPMLAQCGEALLDELIGALDPMEGRFTVLLED